MGILGILLVAKHRSFVLQVQSIMDFLINQAGFRVSPQIYQRLLVLVENKYFLKCTSGCENIVLFYSQYSKTWEPPRAKAAEASKPNAADCLTKYACPVCQQPMAEYGYEKDGQAKKLLRCSAAKAKGKVKKHKDVVYFSTTNGWWSPKYGNLLGLS